MPPLIKKLGSLNFAITLIAALALILIGSTTLESLYGTPFAQENFYQAHWFDFFLGLTWVNIFCATLTRLPFKKKHVGFVITHIGILTLLIGALVTRLMGVEGQMTLFENEAKNSMLRTGFSLVVTVPGGGEKKIDLNAKPVKRPVPIPLERSPFRLLLTQVYPHAEEARLIEDTTNGEPNAAVEAVLRSEMLGMEQKFTLVENDPADRGARSQVLGPATFEIVRDPGKKNNAAISSRLILRQTSTDKTFELDLDETTQRAVWEEAGLVIEPIRYIPRARVVDGSLVNDDKAPYPNPAVEFVVSDENGHHEHHTRFAIFPDINSLRGGDAGNVFDLVVALDTPETAPDTERSGPAFQFLVSEGEPWKTRVISSKTGPGESTPLAVGQPVRTGWMDMTLSVEKIYDRAKVTRVVREDPEKVSEVPAVELRIQREGKIEETRKLILGRSLLVGSGDASIRISLATRSQELPFSLALRDFRKIDYPGTSNPASFESDVSLRNPTEGLTLEKTISMNKPLDHAGYRVFQSSFIQDDQLGEASVFTIAKNPGMPLIYGGAFLILIGVILLFYFHPFFNSQVRYNEPMPSQKKRSRRSLTTVIALLALTLPVSACAAESRSPYEPVLHNGRVKPFDSFARQTLKTVSGRSTWQKQDAASFIAGLTSARETVAALKWIRVDFEELKGLLGLNKGEHFFSYEELAPSFDKINALVKSSREKRDRDQRPSAVEQKAEQLMNQLNNVEALASGAFPMPIDEDHPASETRLRAEVLYNRLKPFEMAAALYFVFFFLDLLFKKNRPLTLAGGLAVMLAFAFHTAGLAARCYILSRPPVSNMYESMIFMNWALMVYALVFAAIRRNVVAVAAGSLISAFVMLYANLLPIDPSLDVVVAVLRSNYWLTIHVLTIVSSYGAFGLALALGHRYLFLRRFGKLSKTQDAESASLLFRVIQLGVILIGVGTFLGGVWANESWGRFWGWDPKETWAFITFLGYLIVVHLRYARKMSNIAMAAASILGFLLVLMTWYGVNFVLGRGLHSYGSGSGGMQWVIYFLLFEAIFLGWAFSKKAVSG